MNGARSLLRTAADAGVELCFANPGTTEMPLVAALDEVPEVRAVLGLFEGVCTGAADGYGRMTGRPALTLLHLGPGFANGIANLHNARRAHTPVVNLIGDHASWHRAYDAPLTSDIVSLASPVSDWVRTATSAKRLANDVAEAIAAALEPPGQVATLIVPADFQWGEGAGLVAVRPSVSAGVVSTKTVDRIADRLRASERAVLLLGGGALSERGQRAAARVADAVGGRLFAETFPARWERGGDLPAVARLPYFPEQGAEALGDAEVVVLAGAREPVAFFGYEGHPSRLAPEDAVATLCEPKEDPVGALESLALALDAPPTRAGVGDFEAPALPSGELTPGSAGQALAACLPENAIVVDEAATSGLAFYAFSERAPRHTLLTLTGGAIGQGLPCATGAAIACPDRKVVAFQADGSAQYTVQSLWTQARESLDVTTLLCSNRSYRILQIELGRAGIAEPGPQARSLTQLDRPALDWCALARGYGVPAQRIETADALAAALPRALAEPGPQLLELLL
ncbi:MAG: acetolactate synthase large subunit [Proteobacteria bacterium]|nr:acetolactate synthase large subunit [Pseudomonadota bacterium]